jgi:hypothetical protein
LIEKISEARELRIKEGIKMRCAWRSFRPCRATMEQAGAAIIDRPHAASGSARIKQFELTRGEAYVELPIAPDLLLGTDHGKPVQLSACVLGAGARPPLPNGFA